MHPEEHEAHHKSLEERVSKIEQMIEEAKRNHPTPSVPPAQPEAVAEPAGGTGTPAMSDPVNVGGSPAEAPTDAPPAETT